MVVIFGGESGYLEKKRWLLLLAALAVVVAFIALVLVVPRLASFGLWVVAGIMIIIIVGEDFLKLVEQRFNRVDNGMSGEDAVVRELKKLPDGFVVFRGLKVGEHQDIDCAVIGPTGVFAVEVKSHRGRVGFNGRELTRDGRVFEKDFFRETMAEATGLRGLIERGAGIDVFVEPIIVFSRADVALGSEKIRGCYVIGKSWLNELVQSKVAYSLNDDFVLKIASALTGLVDDKRKGDKIKQLENALHKPL
jgi:Nuclease-related domain